MNVKEESAASSSGVSDDLFKMDYRGIAIVNWAHPWHTLGVALWKKRDLNFN